MRVLLISTCGPAGVVALASDTEVLAEHPLPSRGASEALMPALRKVLGAAACTVAYLQAVAVVDGPGSFTGVRIGLAAAKGLCQATGAQLIAVSRLALLAAGDGATTAVLDAGRSEYFCGVYSDGTMRHEDLLSEADTRIRIATGRAVACEEKVAVALGIELLPEPDAHALLAAARVRIRAGDWSDVALADARYLRRTDAEIKANAR